MRQFSGITLAIFCSLFIFILYWGFNSDIPETKDTTLYDLIFPFVIALVTLTFAFKLILPKRDIPTNQLIYSGYVIRALSILIDGTLLMAPFFVFMIYYDYFSGFSFGAIYLSFYIFPILLNTYLLTRYGASIGKMICKLQVVNLDLTKVNFKVIALRSSVDYIITLIGFIATLHHFDQINILGLSDFSEIKRSTLTPDRNSMLQIILDNTYLIWISLEALFVMYNKKSRALHDYLAGTVVVRKAHLNKIAPI